MYLYKLVSMKLDLSIYNIIYLYVCEYKIDRSEIRLFKLVNNFIISLIIVCNVLII